MIKHGKNLKKESDFLFISDFETNKSGYMLLVDYKDKQDEKILFFTIRLYFEEFDSWYDLNEVMNKDVIRWERRIKNVGTFTLPFRLPNRSNKFELKVHAIDNDGNEISDELLVGDITINAIPIV